MPKKSIPCNTRRLTILLRFQCALLKLDIAPGIARRESINTVRMPDRMISKFGLIELRTANKKKSSQSIPIRHNKKQILFTFYNSPHHTVVCRLKRGRSAIFPHGTATGNVIRGGAAGGDNISSVGRRRRRRRQRDIGPLHGITVEERNLHTTRVCMQHGFPPLCSELPGPYSSRKEHRKTESCATEKRRKS